MAAEKATATEPHPSAVAGRGRLNTEDIKYAMAYVVTRGNASRPVAPGDFQFLVSARDTFVSYVDGDTWRSIRGSSPVQWVSGKVRGALDADKDGRIGAGDYLAAYGRTVAYLNRKQPVIDPYLPFVGQCCFGIACGMFVGAIGRRLWSNSVFFAVIALGGYSALTYLSEQGVVQRDVLQARLKEGLKGVIDVNGDGVIDRKDAEAMLASKMQIVNDKLGPGGFAPGLVGLGTFTFGLWRGLRRR